MMEKLAQKSKIPAKLRDMVGIKVKRSLKEALADVAEELERQHLKFLRRQPKGRR